MYNHRSRFLFALLFILLLCSSAQATTSLLITVQDNIDNSTLSHATVFVNGANYARTNANGQVYLTHSGLTDQEIQVSMSGYNDWSQTVSKNATVLLVNLSRKTLTFTVDLYDSDTLGPISGASINLTADNTSQMKQTDTKGSATFAVTAATLYSIDINAANYQSRSSTIDMGTENQEVQYKLLSGNSFSFVVKDKDTSKAIPGAEIRINAVLAGKTDDRGILITPVTRGKTYTLELKKDGYQTYTESRAISESDAVYYASLSKAPIGAFVYVIDESRMPVSSADVYVNGTLSGSTNEYGRMNFPTLVTGDYLLEVRKSGYVTQERAISVSGQSLDYTFTLPYESAALTISVLDKDKSIVPNASISVDGNPAGVTDDNGQLLTHITFNTDVNISVTKDGYVPLSVKKQVIQGNGTATTTIVLEKSLDWGLIGMIILGAIGVVILFAVIRMLGGRKRRHSMRRRDEI
ncbi:MAG: carboxypeptidase-like regulatory domain-containing protein [Methanoregula sp.]|nr:carboxypeptidase-like regulatory domain-containing protein [Methanoregula sp.]